MKRLSIRAKITLWFALAMSVLAALTLGCVWMISDNVVQKNIKDSLVEMVSDNVDEVEYYRNKEDANPDGDRDIYIQYKNGYLEIDDDYLDQMNGIYTTLYKEDYELLYGENPIAEASGDIAFAEVTFQLRFQLVATVVIYVKGFIFLSHHDQLLLLYRETGIDEENGILFLIALATCEK